MDFKKIIREYNNKDEILLGYNEEGLLSVNIKDNSSIIITGSTGTGKSILLDQIILQLINNHTSLELGLALIDTSGVELNYYQDTNYSLISAFNDEDKSIVIISRILKEIERRKTLLSEMKVLNVDDYNKYSDVKLPYIVLAIDDDKLLLRNPDMEKMLSGIISQIPGLNIMLLLATSDIYNKFFVGDKNTLASLLISFDYVSDEDSKKANIIGIENLGIGKFKVKSNDTIREYNNFDFDDNIIKEIVGYKNN